MERAVDNSEREARWRVLFGIAGLATVLAASTYAFLQRPHAVPFDPVDPLEAEGWFSPVESNTFRRMAGRRYQGAELFGTADAGRLWLVTQDFVLSSNDRGRTWERDNVPGEAFTIEDELVNFELTSLAASSDGSVVIAVGGNGFLVQRSEDGGATWRLVAGEPNPFLNTPGGNLSYRETLRAVALSADGRRAVAVGSFGVILTTRDGITWEFDHSGKTRWPLRAAAMSADGETAIVVGGSTNSHRLPGQIVSTNDGGQNWLHQEIGELGVELNPTSVALSADGQYAIVVGRTGSADSASVLVGADGGNNWQAVDVGAALRLRSVAMSSDGSITLAVGGANSGDGQGVILRSLDRGASWTRIPTETTLPALASVYLDHAGRSAVAVAENGVVLTSANGGVSWIESGIYYRAPGLWYYVALLCGAVLLVLSVKPLRIGSATSSLADHYTNDAPVTASEADRLQFTPIAEGLSHFLRNRNTEPPLTIAITGQWGSGKTSLMGLLKQDLKLHGMSTVWFNAWHHQTEESLLASLLEAIRQQGIPPLWMPEGLVFRVRLLFTRLKRDLRSSAYLFGALLLLAVLTAVFTSNGNLHAFVMAKLPDTFKDSIELLQRNWPVMELVSLSLLVLGVTWLVRRSRTLGIDPARLIVRVGQRARIRDLQQQLSVRHRFASEFADITAALRPMSTLVIIIDDLDRCQAKHVIEILESVNFLVSAGQCFVIFGMDLEPVVASIEKHFEDIAGHLNATDDIVDEAAREEAGRRGRINFARHYLEKLINIEVPVPALQPDAVRQLIAQRRAVDAKHDSQRMAFWLSRFRVVAMVAGLWIGLLGVAVILGITTQLKLDNLAAALTEVDRQRQVEQTSPETQTPPAPPSPSDEGESWSIEQLRERAIDPEDAPRKIDRTEIAAPGLVERVRAHSTWTFLLPLSLAAFGILTLTIVGRWRSARTDDSESFTRALARWAPVSQVLSRTPRAFKRYQNRVRFLAMRQEREPRDTDPIPEPMLVALGALETIDPTLTTPQHFFHIFKRSGELREESDLPPILKSDAFRAALQRTLAAEPSSKVEGPAWPPNDTQLKTFTELSSGFFTTQVSDGPS